MHHFASLSIAGENEEQVCREGKNCEEEEEIFPHHLLPSPLSRLLILPSPLF